MQRDSLGAIRERYGARVARLCYPPMPTTAIGIIPGGLLVYALAAQILKEQGQHQTLGELAARTMTLWGEPGAEGDVRLDAAYQASLGELRARLGRLQLDTIREELALVYQSPR